MSQVVQMQFEDSSNLYRFPWYFDRKWTYKAEVRAVLSACRD